MRSLSIYLDHTLSREREREREKKIGENSPSFERERERERDTLLRVESAFIYTHKRESRSSQKHPRRAFREEERRVFLLRAPSFEEEEEEEHTLTTTRDSHRDIIISQLSSSTVTMCSTSSSFSSSSSRQRRPKKGAFKAVVVVLWLAMMMMMMMSAHSTTFFVESVEAATTDDDRATTTIQTTLKDFERDKGKEVSKKLVSKSTHWQSDPSYRKMAPKSLVFPGTHDSGAYFLTNTFQPGKQSPVPDWVKSVAKVAKTVGIPIEELVARWAKTQKQTVFEQLRTGARYLDLRCGWQGRGGGGGDKQGTWKIHHALVGVDVSIVLEDVANFLRTFTTEVVIVEMSHFYGDPDERAVEQLASEVLGSLGEFVVPYEKDENGDTFWTKPLEVSVKKNQRVLIAFENFNMYNTTDKYKPFLWPWVLENGYADSDDVATMKEYNYDVVRAFNNNTQTEATNKEKENEEEEDATMRLTKLSWILTARAKTVENSIWPLIHNHHPKTIVDLTLKDADRFVFKDFVDLVSKRMNCRFPQVFSVDAWFADSDAGGGVFWKLAKEISARQNSNAFLKHNCAANSDNNNDNSNNNNGSSSSHHHRQ